MPTNELANGPLLSGRPAALISAKIENVGPSPYSRYFKRLFDCSLVVLALPAVLAILAILAMVIFSINRGNPFFSHTRVGRNGKVFGCLKLRTMVVGAEEMLPKLLEGSPEKQKEWAESQKLAQDPRITRLGRVLRKTSLDELPQLLNVLRGDMSLVGPRPIVVDELARYGADVDAYLRLRPGITGLWQTSGRNDVSYAERVQMDVDYGKDVRLRTDVRIIAMTIGAMLRKTGL